MEGSNLKVRIIWHIATVVVVLSSSIIAATSNDTTKFDVGPFNCSVDLNTPCHDINVGKPIHKEMMDRTDYVNYPVEICGVSISFTKYDKYNVFDVEKGVSTQSIFGDLISFGVDMNTIQLYPRIIDGRNGSASVTRLKSDVYDASYIISPRSVAILQSGGPIIMRKWCPS